MSIKLTSHAFIQDLRRLSKVDDIEIGPRDMKPCESAAAAKRLKQVFMKATVVIR